jgi:uncharacterized protein (TIRG00374 family)
MTTVKATVGAIPQGKSRNKRWVTWAQNVIALLIVGGFGYYLWQHRAEFTQVLRLSAADVALIALLVFMTWLFTSVQGYLLNRAAGLQVGFVENFLLTMATAFGNYLPGRAGTLVRAHYLKSVHGLRFARYGSILSIRTVLTVIAAGITGLAGTIWLGLSNGRISLELVLIFGALVVFPGLAYFWRPRQSCGNEQKPGRLTRIWRDFEDGFHELKQRPSMSLWVLFFLLLQYAALGARFVVASKIAATLLPLALATLLAPLAALMSYISITPGGLGLREAVMGYATYAAGSNFAQGIFIGTVDRGVVLLMITFVGGPCFLWLWKRVQSIQHETA